MRHRAPHSARLCTVPRRAESSRVALHLAPIPFPSFSVPSPAATSRHSARTVALKYPPSPCASHSIPSYPERPTDRPPPSTLLPIFPAGGWATTDPGPASNHRYPLPSRSSFLSLCRDFDPARRISQTCLSLPLSPFLFLSLTLGALLSLGEPPSLDICLPLSSCLNPLPPLSFILSFKAPMYFLRCRDGIQERLRD